MCGRMPAKHAAHVEITNFKTKGHRNHDKASQVKIAIKKLEREFETITAKFKEDGSMNTARATNAKRELTREIGQTPSALAVRK